MDPDRTRGFRLHNHLVARMTRDQQAWVYQMFCWGYPIDAIAAYFGVSRQHINAALDDFLWFKRTRGRRRAL